MCGITGFLELPGGEHPDRLRARIESMTLPLTHRGPDAWGTWVHAEAGVALGHRRLSIVDLSDAGAQPMHSASERFVISYNGELYNAEDLAAELRTAGRQLRGHCDTEVLVEAIDAWGLESTLARCNGMFAFALWDRDDRKLHLVRDRLGEKPLYYGWFGSTLLFGSELKALRAHPAFDGEIDRVALTEYLRFNCVPSPRSIYEHVKKLPPATVLTIEARSTNPRASQPVAYWSALDYYDAARATSTVSDDDAIEELEELLLDATKLRMRSDVPLGAFLSGGIDSGTVVALMQAQSTSSVRTFTIGSTSRSHNEADRAARMAEHLGTWHSELIVTAADALDLVPRLSEIYDEPFADSSQIPTLLVSELARRDVTVSLSGDGGDEVFGGYDRYRWVPLVANRASTIPLSVRKVGASVMAGIPPRAWDAVTAPLPSRFRPQIPATKIAKLSSISVLDTPADMYRALVSHFDDPTAIVNGGSEPEVAAQPRWPVGEIAQHMMARDTVTYLPDDILVKLDRATMSVSLEGRIPFLDHRVVELMARMPLHMKIRDGESKWLLRRVLERHVPATVFAGPKSGFGVPIGSWLRGALRPWVEDLISPTRLARDGYLEVEPVRRMWEEHLGRRRDWGYHLWDVLMFQAWLDTWTSTAT
jgi:asparagine synthase (glutamine-hydrolysing)